MKEFNQSEKALVFCANQVHALTVRGRVNRSRPAVKRTTANRLPPEYRRAIKMTYRKPTLRFHVDTGPDALFERVRYKMSTVKTLSFDTPHAKRQAEERGAPVELLREFQSHDWEVVTAEVDREKGKFINSTWARQIDENTWWVVIGLHNAIVTVMQKRGRGLGRKIVRGGDDYAFVRRVNEELMTGDL